MADKRCRIQNRVITVRAIDALQVRAERIIQATLPDVLISKKVRIELFPCSADQVARFRRVLKEAIAEDPALDTTVLLASELAANAIRHSSSEFFGLVIACTGDGGLRIAVIDEGCTGFPCLREETAEGESGRGLRLLDALAARWGIIRQPGMGVAIWFDIT